MFQYFVSLCLLLLYGFTSISAESDDRFVRSNNLTAEALIARKQQVNQHLKIIIIIGAISVVLMIVIVCAYIGIKYCTMKKHRDSPPPEQHDLLDQTRKKSRREK